MTWAACERVSTIQGFSPTMPPAFPQVRGVLAVGYLAGLLEAPRAVEVGLNAVALAVGAWTFVPQAAG